MNGHLGIKDLSLGRSLQGHQGELETCLLSSYLGSKEGVEGTDRLLV